MAFWNRIIGGNGLKRVGADKMDEDKKIVAELSIIVVIFALVIIGVNMYNSSLPPVEIDYANGDVYRFEQPRIDYEVQFLRHRFENEIDMGIRIFDKNNFVDFASLSGVWNQYGPGTDTFYLEKTGSLDIRKSFFTDNSYPDNIRVMFWISSGDYENSIVLNFDLKDW